MRMLCKNTDANARYEQCSNRFYKPDALQTSSGLHFGEIRGAKTLKESADTVSSFVPKAEGEKNSQ
jgi:hypothetical protein